MTSPSHTVILGIDPGTRITGYGVIHFENNSIAALDFGCIRPPANLLLSDRYLIIHEGIEGLIIKYSPSAIVVETQYVGINPQSVLKLGMARASVVLAAKRHRIPVYAYSPCEAKRSVVGNGKASKHQVQRMVQSLLKLKNLPEPEDAADALALAICHAHIATHLKKEF